MSEGDRPRVHSEDYFGDARDYWWNPDYVALLARRWRGEDVRRVLDVGTGFGHWMRALAKALPAEAHFIGMDPEADSLKEAERRAHATGLASRALFRLGRAEAIPFHDDVFDLVTCQTVLIHVADPAQALAEMVRVTKPGGLVAVVEPDNLAAGFGFESRFTGADDDTVLALVRLQLVCEKGKRALGEGDNSLGARLPELFAHAGLEGVDGAQNDRSYSMIPPYARPHERAELADIARLSEIEHFVWRRADTERYWKAGGGSADDLHALWALARKERQRINALVAAKKWFSAGGNVTHVVWGRKPRA